MPQKFFADVKVDGSDMFLWYRGMNAAMERAEIQTSMKDGTDLDQSAEPIYAEHVKDMVCAFAKAGTRESAMRKLCVLLL